MCVCVDFWIDTLRVRFKHLYFEIFGTFNTHYDIL